MFSLMPCIIKVAIIFKAKDKCSDYLLSIVKDLSTSYFDLLSPFQSQDCYKTTNSLPFLLLRFAASYLIATGYRFKPGQMVKTAFHPEVV